MKDYSDALKDLLGKNGWHFHRQGKGSHEVWCSPDKKKFVTVFANMKSRHTANDILKDASIKHKF